MKASVSEMITFLELNPDLMNKVCTTQNEVQQMVDNFQEEVRKSRKRLAKKYHPDMGGSVEDMQKLNFFADHLLTLRPVRRPQATHIDDFMQNFHEQIFKSMNQSFSRGGFTDYYSTSSNFSTSSSMFNFRNRT